MRSTFDRSTSISDQHYNREERNESESLNFPRNEVSAPKGCTLLAESRVARSGSAVYSISPSTPRSRRGSTLSLSKENGRTPDDSVLVSPKLVESFFSSNKRATRKHPLLHKSNIKIVILLLLLLLATFFLFDGWFLVSLRQSEFLHSHDNEQEQLRIPFQSKWIQFERPRIMYERLLGLAQHALAEGELKKEPEDLWEEPFTDGSIWRPCADNTAKASVEGIHRTGYILVSANGGLNQQRVAICNAVAVARLLNATLVLPNFLYSSVWKDTSQFEDIYEKDFFINYLKDDITIVEELPEELQSLDLEAIGSLLTDMDVMKEAKPSFYATYILPILLRNRVVHFYGFGNRLSFDPLPFEVQRLRCKCNFHALRFIPKIQRAAALMVERMRDNTSRWGPQSAEEPAEKYLGLHLRFEIDMVAYSTCEFGGGETEWQELEAYREIHFPTLMQYKNSGKLLSPTKLREEGKCPLTPEEAALMLAALGFRRSTRIFLAGAHFYGGQSRMAPVSSLYPNVVTKEDLLSKDELQPFMNRSSQLAALDFIACISSDVFAMTDSGSQLSSLVTGYRIYYGGGRLPTIRPNKRRLASIFTSNMTIEWDEFRERVRKTVKESKKVQIRPVARSVYRHPRCPECMCMDNVSMGHTGALVLTSQVE